MQRTFALQAFLSFGAPTAPKVKPLQTKEGEPSAGPCLEVLTAQQENEGHGPSRVGFLLVFVCLFF